MNKRDAIKAMLDGEKVMTKAWEGSTKYMYIDDNFKILYDWHDEQKHVGFSIDAFTSSVYDVGWEIYKEPVKIDVLLDAVLNDSEVD